MINKDVLVSEDRYAVEVILENIHDGDVPYPLPTQTIVEALGVIAEMAYAGTAHKLADELLLMVVDTPAIEEAYAHVEKWYE
jgi:hypothetical protein